MCVCVRTCVQGKREIDKAKGRYDQPSMRVMTVL